MMRFPTRSDRPWVPAFLAMLCTTASAGDGVRCKGRDILGGYDTTGTAMKVVLDGSTAYVCDWDKGLHLVDVSNPEYMFQRGRLLTPGTARAVALVGDIAILAAGESGLLVIDVSNPDWLQIAATYPVPGSAVDIDVVGGLAYVASGSDGLLILDVTDPTLPQPIGEIPLAGTTAEAFVAGSTAYVAASEGVHIVDLSDPAAPVLRGTYEIGGAKDVVVEGDLAYIAGGSSGLIVDVSDPANPSLVGVMPSLAEGMHLAAGDAWISGGRLCSVYDVSDPSSPILRGVYELPGGMGRMTSLGLTGFAACGEAGLYAFDMSAPKPYSWIASIELPDSGGGMEVVGDLLFVAVGASSGEVQIINVSDPAAPVLLASVSARGPKEVAVEGATLYIATVFEGVLVYDVSIPVLPRFLGRFRHESSIYEEIEVRGNLAYMRERHEGVQIADVSDPTAIELLSIYQSDLGPAEIAVEGSTLYAVDGEWDLQMIDVSDPGAPVLRGVYEAPATISSYVVDGETAYIAYFSLDRVGIVDVADPADPDEIGSTDFFHVSSVAIAGRTLYASEYSGDPTLAFDIGTPAVPRLSGVARGRHSVRDMIATESNVFISELSDSEPRVAIIDAADCWECPADWNRDGRLDSTDVIAYLNSWVLHDPDADWNGDGTVDTRDVLGYLNAWKAGC